jgi:uncharacterized protein
MSDACTLQEFPCFYTFKIFGRHNDTLADRVRCVLNGTLGPVPLDSVKVRGSARGRYQSITVCIQVASREQLERAYDDLRAEEEVLFCL